MWREINFILDPLPITWKSVDHENSLMIIICTTYDTQTVGVDMARKIIFWSVKSYSFCKPLVRIKFFWPGNRDVGN